MNEQAIMVMTGICLVSMLCQWLAWRVRLPAILFLLVAGFFLGPMTDVLKPDEIFGDLLFPFVSLAVAIILFEGSLTLKLSELSGLSHTITRLITLGAAITWLVIGLSGYYIFGFSWQLATLLGALCVVTGPTVIMPILRTVRPNDRVTNILRWEGILIDPVGALLTVVTFEFIILQSNGGAIIHTVQTFAEILLIGGSAGIAAGYILGLLLRHNWLPEFLQSLAALSLLFLAFSVSNHFAEESGLLAVTLMGVWLANMRDVDVSSILNFKENLTILFISGLFILLAARLDLSQLQSLNWVMLSLFAIVQFVARPISVWVCSLGSSLNWREKIVLSWIAPRGIVAAAVSAVFALRLEQTEMTDANLLVPLTFMIIVGTVVLQSATAGPIARWLKVSEPAPTGVLIVGANAVARTLGKAIKDLGFKVLLAGTSRTNVHDARMAGLDTFYGNPASEYADQRLNLSGMGKLIALAPSSELNNVVATRYRNDFGKENIYALASAMDKMDSQKHRVANAYRNYQLLGDNISYGKLASLIGRGAQIKKTKLTDEYGHDEYLKDNAEAVPLLLLSPDKELIVVSKETLEYPKSGWVIVSLVNEPQTAA